jgi:hypothetical protein
MRRSGTTSNCDRSGLTSSFSQGDINRKVLPVVPVAGKGARGVALDGNDRAVAVVLHLVDPAGRSRRLIDKGVGMGMSAGAAQLDMDCGGCKGESRRCTRSRTHKRVAADRGR